MTGSNANKKINATHEPDSNISKENQEQSNKQTITYKQLEKDSRDRYLIPTYFSSQSLHEYVYKTLIPMLSETNTLYNKVYLDDVGCKFESQLDEDNDEFIELVGRISILLPSGGGVVMSSFWV